MMVKIFRIRWLLLAAISLLVTGSALCQKPKVWIDTDTGNETDDVYAIVRLLNDTSVDVVGLSSAHFNNADLVAYEKWNQYVTKNINTVQLSQQLNEEILSLTGKTYILHPLGADRQMGRAWGGKDPRQSAASEQLIATVKKLPAQQKLIVICIGAVTNLASAIALDSTIITHIKCYVLGAKYDAHTKAWDKNEFNIRNDLNAFDYLLNNAAVDLTVMPTTTAAPFRFERDSLYAVFPDNVPVLAYLKKRWKETNPDDKTRTLWDVALIEAFLNPSLATIQDVHTPPENRQRQVRVYTAIDLNKMKQDYLLSVEKIATKKEGH